MEEYWQAFENLKKSLASLSLFSKLELGKELYLYLTTSEEAISSILIQLDDKRVQRPISTTSRVLQDVKTRYSKSKKIVFILITFAQYFRHISKHT